MNEFLSTLEHELEMVDDLGAMTGWAPDTPPERHEQQHGEASEYVKKLFVLCGQYTKRAAELAIEGRFDTSPDKRQEVIDQLNKIQAKVKVFSEIMWYVIREDQDLWEADTIGIRTGWIVVSFNGPPSIHGIIGQIFQGD